MKKLIVMSAFFLVVVGLIMTGFNKLWQIKNQGIKKPQMVTSNLSIVAIPTSIPTSTPTPSPTIIKKSKVLIENVPFAPQAPFAEWKDERFQDGCEEAAAVLAVYWARGLSLDKTKMQDEIIKMSAFQSEKYGEFRDTSVKDSSERLLKDYFNFSDFEVKGDISISDIKNELLKGNLVIVPANGQTLGNPHFTQPGPERHNLIIRGFDDQKGIFITNDPGIKEGEFYEYPQSVLYLSIRDYPTGFHQPILEIKKDMIIIKKV